MNEITAIIGIDPGTQVSGIAIIEHRRPVKGLTVMNSHVYSHIRDFCVERRRKGQEYAVVIEDIVAYSTRMGKTTIDTIKFIGQLQWRLDSDDCSYHLLHRATIKNWCYNNQHAYCEEKVTKEIACRKKVNLDGELKKPSYSYMNDRMVAGAMKLQWGLPQKQNKLGFTGHSWQALAAATCFLESQHDQKKDEQIL